MSDFIPDPPRCVVCDDTYFPYLRLIPVGEGVVELTTLCSKHKQYYDSLLWFTTQSGRRLTLVGFVYFRNVMYPV
jgi:hypothetical protein